MDGGIDFVVLWVDGSDPKWQEERRRYLHEQVPCLFDRDDEMNGEVRFRDWGILRYWFRAVEKYAPWVRKVHFVTSDQIPDWLDLGCPRLNYVSQRDYMPEEWLPTFSSHPLELNLFRIKDLAEKFVYFNDDMLLNAPVREEDFFLNGLPRDCAILEPLPSGKGGYPNILHNITRVVRFHSGLENPFRGNLRKWFSPCYGKMLLWNLLLWHWRRQTHCYDPHLPNAYLKSTFVEAWAKVPKFLEAASRHRFRNYYEDVSQLLMREWQLMKGTFYPRSPDFGRCYGMGNIFEATEDIRHQKHRMICVNDGAAEGVDFDAARSAVQRAYQEVLPEKSGFER